MQNKKKKLTNEELTKFFKNPFELVNYSIEVAKHLISSGRELSDIGDKNSAAIVLKKVLKEKEAEEKSEALVELEKKNRVSEEKDFPDPMQQAI